MKELVFVPVAIALLLGTLAELEDLGQQASTKATEHAQQMVAAIDCAYDARPLTDCSPDLYDVEYDEEIAETERLAKEIERASAS